MKRTTLFVTLALMVWLMTAGVSAAGSSALVDTKWAGPLSFVSAGATEITTDNATISFTFEEGEFLAGTLVFTDDETGVAGDAIPFSCIRNGESLTITADGYYLISAAVSKGRCSKRGTPPPQVMTIQGSNAGETGSYMFKGTLKKQET